MDRRALRLPASVLMAATLLLAGGPVGGGPKAQTPAACVPPPSGLVSWWRGEGNAMDHMHLNDGIPAEGTGYAPGMVGRAFRFDGVDDHVFVPNSASLIIDGPFTIELWFSPAVTIGSDDPVPHELWAKGANDSIGTANATGEDPAWIEVRGPTPRPDSTTVTWAGGVWYHLAVVLDGSGYRLYVNAVEQGRSQSTYSILSSRDSISIGRDATTPGVEFQGRIDEVSVYERALSAAEIGSIFAAGSAGKCADSTISGRVSDTALGPMGGVRITAVSVDNPSHSYVADTDATGEYAIAHVPDGTYRLTASRPFHTFEPEPRLVTVPLAAADRDFVGKRSGAISIIDVVTPRTPSFVSTDTIVVRARSAPDIPVEWTVEGRDAAAFIAGFPTHVVRPTDREGISTFAFRPSDNPQLSRNRQAEWTRGRAFRRNEPLTFEVRAVTIVDGQPYEARLSDSGLGLLTQDEVDILRQEYVDYYPAEPVPIDVMPRLGRPWSQGPYGCQLSDDLPGHFRDILAQYRGLAVMVYAKLPGEDKGIYVPATIPAHAAVTVSSAYRNPQYNRAIGSVVAASLHAYGRALDLVPNPVTVQVELSDGQLTTVRLGVDDILYPALRHAALATGAAARCEADETHWVDCDQPAGWEKHLHVGW